MRDWLDPVVFSHIAFLFNIAFWVKAGSSGCAIMLGMTVIASTIYHRSHEMDRWWGDLDSMTAIITLAYTLAVTVPRMESPHIVGAAVLLASAFFCYLRAHKGDYQLWHTAWHLLIALGQAYLAALYWTCSG